MSDGPRIERAGALIQGLYETDSFVIATTAAPIVVGNDWVQVTGLVAGPYNHQTVEPDLVISDAADAVVATRKGKYHLLVNCQYVSATGDGWFESAIEGHPAPVDSWPTDVDRGHIGGWVSAAAIGWENATLGSHSSVIWPLVAEDEVTAWMKFVSASGTETIEVSAVMFVTRLGH